MMAFLSSEGSSAMELLDYENGPTIMQLLALNVELGRLSLVKQKHIVNDLALALSSLFDSKIIDKFNREIDQALKDSDIFDGESQVNKQNERSRQSEHVVSELGKLSSLFGAAKMQ